MWLDAVYAAYAEAPMQVLQAIGKEMVIKEAMVDPEGARENWGKRPEHIALAGQLGQGAGLESGRVTGVAPETRGRTPGFAPVPQQMPQRRGR